MSKRQGSYTGVRAGQRQSADKAERRLARLAARLADRRSRRIR